MKTLQPSQSRAALSAIEDSGRRKEQSYRDKNGSTIGVEDPTGIHEKIGAVQTTTKPVALSLRQESMRNMRTLKPRPSRKNKALFNQDRMEEEEVKDPGQRDNAVTDLPKDWIHEADPKLHKLARHSRKAQLRDYASRTAEGSKKAIRPSRSKKASADVQTGTRNYKDQRQPWQTQKNALSEKFGPKGWFPRKRLSPDTLKGIRALHAQYPDRFTTPVLADQFKVSPEAIRRILKSKWRPNDEEEEKRRQRWEKRGENIWSQMVEIGIKPPKKWRDMGVGEGNFREAKPARNESGIKSKSKVTSSLLGQTTTISANRHETGSPVPLADRIL